MWPFKKKNPVKQFKEDLDKFGKMYNDILILSVGRVEGMDGFEDALYGQLVDYYLNCRRKHGEHFIHFIQTCYIPVMKENADKWKEHPRRKSMLLAETQLAGLLTGTHECPEIDEVFKYMSVVAKQAREGR